MSSIDTAPQQFQRWTAQPSNVDKCGRCQMPRSVHGNDWSCPPALPHRLPALMLAAGTLLALAGIVARLVVGSATPPAGATLMADAFLAGVVLMVAGVVTGGKQR